MEQRQRRAAARVLARGESYRARIPLIVGGERKHHDVTVMPFEDATAAAAIDAVALEKAQGEPDRQAVPYDRTLDRVATAVAIFNAQQQLVFFNEAYRKLWQLDEDWLKTRPTEGAVLDRLRELGRVPQVVNYSEWKSEILDIYGEGSAEDDTWLLPDGRTLQVLAEKRSDGGVTYLFIDETERLALERDYNALIGVQRETLDSLKEGVAVFGTDGRLKLFNSALAEIWQLSRRALAEEPHIDEFILQAREHFDDPHTWARLSRVATSFSEQREEFGGQMIRPDGSIVDYAAMPLPDGATLITFADVTDSKRYERALEERNDALVAGDRMKNAFISHVSYELRTPLTNIIGFSELLGNPHIGQLNEKQHEYLGDISASSKTLLAIIDDILTLATMDAGTMELKLGRVDVQAVIDAAILGVREAAQRARLSLHIAVAEDATQLIADEARVRQILFNLLSNAVGFSKPGDTIGITARREGGMMEFTVEDQGVGIPKDQQWKVFDRFESSSHGSSHRGAGLGLSIVKSLVELHGGTVTPATPSPAAGRASLCAFPSTGGPRKLPAARCPKKALRARYRPVAAPPRSEMCMSSDTASHVIDSLSEPAAGALGCAACVRGAARRPAGFERRPRRRQDDAGTRRHPIAHRRQGRGDTEPDVHAGAELCDAAHAGGASRPLPVARALRAGRAWPRSGAPRRHCHRRMARAGRRSVAGGSARLCASTIATAALRGA